MHPPQTSGTPNAPPPQLRTNGKHCPHPFAWGPAFRGEHVRRVRQDSSHKPWQLQRVRGAVGHSCSIPAERYPHIGLFPSVEAESFYQDVSTCYDRIYLPSPVNVQLNCNACNHGRAPNSVFVALSHLAASWPPYACNLRFPAESILVAFPHLVASMGTWAEDSPFGGTRLSCSTRFPGSTPGIPGSCRLAEVALSYSMMRMLATFRFPADSIFVALARLLASWPLHACNLRFPMKSTLAALAHGCTLTGEGRSLRFRFSDQKSWSTDQKFWSTDQNFW